MTDLGRISPEASDVGLYPLQSHLDISQSEIGESFFGKGVLKPDR